MPGQNDSTVSMRQGNKWPWERLLKMLIPIVLFGIAVFLTVSQDWMGTTKQGAVDTVRVTNVEEQIKEIKGEYVRKDVLEPRLAAFEASVAEVRSDQKEANRLLQQILFEQRKR